MWGSASVMFLGPWSELGSSRAQLWPPRRATGEPGILLAVLPGCPAHTAAATPACTGISLGSSKVQRTDHCWVKVTLQLYQLLTHLQVLYQETEPSPKPGVHSLLPVVASKMLSSTA